MPKNQLRVFTGAALVANLAAAALTLALRPPTGPGDPNAGLYECTLWFMTLELLLLAGYYACLLYCERGSDEGKELCYYYCLRWWIYTQLMVVLGYLICLVNAVWF